MGRRSGSISPARYFIRLEEAIAEPWSWLAGGDGMGEKGGVHGSCDEGKGVFGGKRGRLEMLKGWGYFWIEVETNYEAGDAKSSQRMTIDVLFLSSCV